MDLSCCCSVTKKNKCDSNVLSVERKSRLSGFSLVDKILGGTHTHTFYMFMVIYLNVDAASYMRREGIVASLCAFYFVHARSTSVNLCAGTMMMINIVYDEL